MLPTFFGPMLGVVIRLAGSPGLSSFEKFRTFAAAAAFLGACFDLGAICPLIHMLEPRVWSASGRASSSQSCYGKLGTGQHDTA